MMNEPKTVLYLSYTGMTDPLGQSQVLAYLKELARGGTYRFVLVSFEKSEVYNRLKETISDLCLEAGIEWHPLSYTAKPPVFSTLNDVRRMRKKAKELMRKHSFSLVHCRSYIPSLVGLFLKKRYGIPFLFDMRGFWADERVDGGLWNLSSPGYRLIYNYFKRKEKEFLQQADQTVSLTYNAKHEIENWNLKPQPSPITVIPCCADFEAFNPAGITREQRRVALSSLNIPENATVFSYLGTLGTWYMLDEMMTFARSFQQKNANAYFMVLTGEPESLVREAAKKTGFDDRFLRVKRVPRNEVPVYISLSSFSIFFIKPAFSKKASSPVKQGELMAMGVPVVCNDSLGDTADIVKECKAGIVLNGFGEAAYRQAAEDIKNFPFDRDQIRKCAHKYFLLSNGVSLYESVYSQMTK